MTGRRGDPEFLVVGQLSKPHGTKGEIFVWPLTDHPDSTFQPDTDILIAGADGNAPDVQLAPLRVSAVRPYRAGFLVFFEGIEDREGAEALRGRYLLRPFDSIDPLEEEEIFHHQLVGLVVVTRGGREVGRIRQVYVLPQADLVEVEGPDKNHLIPFTRQVIVDWSVEEGRLVIDPPEGLLDL